MSLAKNVLKTLSPITLKNDYILGKDIPFTHFGGNGLVLHFSAANGFHPNAYQHLLEPLSQDYEVNAMHFRPFWKNSRPKDLKNWKDMIADLVAFLEHHYKGQPVIGIGHSMGASVSILAAHQRPDLFSKLILIEPVLLPKAIFRIQKLLPFFLFDKIMPVSKVARNRTDVWESKQAAYDYLRPKKVFKDIPDAVFEQFINAAIITRKDGKGTLSYSKAWEAQVYSTVGNIWPSLPELKMPVLALRGKTSNTIRRQEWRAWQNLSTATVFKEFDGLGHLLPLEDPQLIEQTIRQFLTD